MLPTVSFAGHEISRLIIGGNPFSGNSHVSAEMDREMIDYFSTENIKRALFRCIENGINAMQLRGDRHITRIIHEFRREGGRMHWIAQTASELGDFQGGLNAIMNFDPIAIYLHGSITDELFKAGDFEGIRRRLEAIRRTGAFTGIGTHMPEVVEYADENFDVDFHMTSVYNLSKIHRVSSAVTGRPNSGEPFDDEDREVMYRAVRKTEKPCLVFKILGSTRLCGTPGEVREAFREAFENIKPIDSVVVGMFPRDRDQLAENAGFVREILNSGI